VPHATFQSINQQYLKMYVYRMQHAQTLREQDYQEQFTFACIMCQDMELGRNFLNWWLFTDKVTVHITCSMGH
jgi:hypothetical protein